MYNGHAQHTKIQKNQNENALKFAFDGEIVLTKHKTIDIWAISARRGPFFISCCTSNEKAMQMRDESETEREKETTMRSFEQNCFHFSSFAFNENIKHIGREANERFNSSPELFCVCFSRSFSSPLLSIQLFINLCYRTFQFSNGNLCTDFSSRRIFGIGLVLSCFWQATTSKISHLNAIHSKSSLRFRFASVFFPSSSYFGFINAMTCWKNRRWVTKRWMRHGLRQSRRRQWWRQWHSDLWFS